LTSLPAAFLGYAIRAIESGDMTGRLARQLQSRAASDLLSALKTQAPYATAHSKSHSRALVAVAVGHMDGLQLGIDIEWIDAARPVGQIASYLDWGEVGQEAFYRGWTFREAYYKAFQKNPSKALAVTAMQECPDESTIEIEDGSRLFQRRVFRDFQLSLVWKSAGSQTIVPACLAPSMV
jgi:hypothetical protein